MVFTTLVGVNILSHIRELSSQNQHDVHFISCNSTLSFRDNGRCRELCFHYMVMELLQAFMLMAGGCER